MKKKLLFFTISILSVAMVLFFWENRKTSEGQIQINNQKIEVEIAKTLEDRAKGLSGKKSLCADCGMLFVFEKSGNYQFWMKEMNFNLDMLWIKDNRIVKIKENIPYQKGEGELVSPGVLADKVLEINAGKSSQWGIKEGDKVIFDLK